ncbi:hypothetical protein C7W88_17860 (plasmid) [Novosphingobium sp. THN1]|nr:hypothetical protein C7W88_17860 [Novosphingobium sp. THN1]
MAIMLDQKIGVGLHQAPGYTDIAIKLLDLSDRRLSLRLTKHAVCNQGTGDRSIAFIWSIVSQILNRSLNEGALLHLRRRLSSLLSQKCGQIAFGPSFSQHVKPCTTDARELREPFKWLLTLFSSPHCVQPARDHLQIFWT